MFANKYTFYFYCLLPVLFGGIIYFFRETNIRLFTWLENFTRINTDILWYFRESARGLNLPNWLIYNLPDGLWQFALCNGIILIWKKDRGNLIVAFIMSSSLGLTLEIFQYFQIISGTFDIVDIFFYLLGALLSLLTFRKAFKIKNP